MCKSPKFIASASATLFSAGQAAGRSWEIGIGGGDISNITGDYTINIDTAWGGAGFYLDRNGLDAISISGASAGFAVSMNDPVNPANINQTWTIMDMQQDNYRPWFQCDEQGGIMFGMSWEFPF